MKMRKNTPANFGFTLLETLVAVAVLTIAVTAFLTVMTRGISIGSYAEDEMTASFLAQDAMEYIRAKKNENILAGLPWLTGFKGGGGPCRDISGINYVCRVDTLDDIPPGYATRCLPANGDPFPGVCRPLWYNSGTGTYGYSTGAGWARTKFTRTINMNEIVDDREVRVTVTVTFPQGRATKSTRFDQNMFNAI